MSLELVVAKIVITETDGRDQKWPNAFAKELSKATSQKWDVEGWVQTDRGWDCVFNTMEYRLALKFSDGIQGWIATAYRISVLGSADQAITVNRVFNNSKELFSLLKESIGKFEQKAARQQVEKQEYLLVMGLIFEDGYYDLPKDMKVVFPADNYDPDNYDPQFLLAYKKFQAAQASDARDELRYLKKNVLNRWQEGYYPPNYALVNLTAQRMVETNIGSEGRGYLGTFNGKKYMVSDVLKLAGIKVKINASFSEVAQVMSHLQGSLRDGVVVPPNPHMSKAELRAQRRILAEAAITTGSIDDAMRDCWLPIDQEFMNEFQQVVGFRPSSYGDVKEHLLDIGFIEISPDCFERNGKVKSNREEVRFDSGVMIYRKGNGPFTRYDLQTFQKMVGAEA